MDEALNEYTQNIVESPLTLDLSKSKRYENFGVSARIMKLWIPPESNLKYGDPMTLNFIIECCSPVTNIVLGVGFDTLDGYRILTLDSDNSAPPMRLDAGTHEISFHVARNPLHPGTYSCGTSLMSGAHILDLVLNCATWEVQSSLVVDRGFSGCRLPVDVKIETIRHEARLANSTLV